MVKPPVDKERETKAIPVEFNDEEISGYGIPGSVQANPEFLIIACPGCGHVSGITIGNPKPKKSPSWCVAEGNINDVTTITLRPSINCIGCCGWHGYLTRGVFKPCSG